MVIRTPGPGGTVVFSNDHQYRRDSTYFPQNNCGGNPVSRSIIYYEYKYDDAKKEIENIRKKATPKSDKGPGFPNPTKGEIEVIAALEKSISKLGFELLHVDLTRL